MRRTKFGGRRPLLQLDAPVSAHATHIESNTGARDAIPDASIPAATELDDFLGEIDGILGLGDAVGSSSSSSSSSLVRAMRQAAEASLLAIAAGLPSSALDAISIAHFLAVNPARTGVLPSHMTILEFAARCCYLLGRLDARSGEGEEGGPGETNLPAAIRELIARAPEDVRQHASFPSAEVWQRLLQGLGGSAGADASETQPGSAEFAAPRGSAPAEMQAVAAEGFVQDCADDHVASVVTLEDGSKLQLPTGWIGVRDPATTTLYYAHPETGESRWAPPPGHLIVRDAPVDTHTTLPSAVTLPLPLATFPVPLSIATSSSTSTSLLLRLGSTELSSALSVQPSITSSQAAVARLASRSLSGLGSIWLRSVLAYEDTETNSVRAREAVSQTVKKKYNQRSDIGLVAYDSESSDDDPSVDASEREATSDCAAVIDTSALRRDVHAFMLTFASNSVVAEAFKRLTGEAEVSPTDSRAWLWRNSVVASGKLLSQERFATMTEINLALIDDMVVAPRELLDPTDRSAETEAKRRARQVIVTRPPQRTDLNGTSQQHQASNDVVTALTSYTPRISQTGRDAAAVSVPISKSSTVASNISRWRTAQAQLQMDDDNDVRPHSAAKVIPAFGPPASLRAGMVTYVDLLALALLNCDHLCRLGTNLRDPTNPNLLVVADWREKMERAKLFAGAKRRQPEDSGAF